MKCIILICGLPASGKSSLIKPFINILKDKRQTIITRDAFLSSVEIVSICYDDLVPLHVQVEKVKLPDEWKHIRHEILEASEMFLKSLDDPFPPHVTSELYERIALLNPRNASSNCLVIVEDNLYYSSMRYSWYQLARKFEAGFCQAWLSCPLGDLMERNANRSCRVPSEVIETMLVRQELPNPEKNPWEKHSVILDRSQNDHGPDLKKLCNLVLKAVSDPTKPTQHLEKDIIPEQFLANDINLVDQILRRRVSSKINLVKGKCPNLAEYSKQENSKRQCILEKLRKGEIEIPPSLNRATDLEMFVNNVYST